jgi:hypothetical protein
VIGFQFTAGIEILFSMSTLGLAPGQSPIEWALETLSLGLGRPELVANYLHPSGTYVKTAWLCKITSTSTTSSLQWLPGFFRRNLPFTTASRPVLGPTELPSLRVPRSLPPGVKRSEREADDTPPTSAEVTNV